MPARAHPRMIGTLRRTFEKFLADQMTDYAAALTYYSMLSLFPALLVGVSVLGLVADVSLVTDAVRYAEEHGAPAEVTDALRSSLTTTIESAGEAVGGALLFGVLVAIYGAAGAFGGAGRALNVVHGTEETRNLVRHKLTDIAWTLVVIALALVSLFSVFLGGDLAHDLFAKIGFGDSAEAVWRVARWFVAVAAVLLIYAITYSFAPNSHPRRMRWITPGAVAGMTLWVAASAGFSYYVSNFGKYGATYGAFAGAVILLLWLWLSSAAFLLGAELNAELGRSRRA